jgi:hypothetical protein
LIENDGVPKKSTFLFAWTSLLGVPVHDERVENNDALIDGNEIKWNEIEEEDLNEIDPSLFLAINSVH